MKRRLLNAQRFKGVLQLVRNLVYLHRLPLGVAEKQVFFILAPV